eukprot:TRINITY_DN2709_c0_g1_i1.p1 TRINITY_DN2709_c0_g1~~TRINITY_DN2709_c0_g1_i1.p1  ORF type:complete len:148 (+),score=11.03 TRINITY_DN2709_c0_g1_i1:157-600(+)
MKIHTLFLSAFAGFWGSMAAVFTKIAAGDSHIVVSLAQSLVTNLSTYCDSHLAIDESSSLILRVIFGGCVVLSNVFMWLAFSQALAMGSSSTECTAINMTANFLTSAVVGVVLFGEMLSPLWFLGSAFVLLGLLHLSGGKDGKEKTD